MRMTKGPVDYEADQVYQEYKEGSKRVRQVLFYSCIRRDFFPILFEEAWAIDPALVKSMAKTVPANEIGPLLLSANGGRPPKIIEIAEKQPQLEFDLKEVNGFFKSLPLAKRKSAVKFLRDYTESEAAMDLNPD
ncbi:MAG: hypothetical protein HY912_18695 [Desulfomonile tiedjei]|uniref:Uncharacterized protein n=1 Tax=Desulfomonile tiedjei TaxID=2358 RepID=A0A9D6V6C2_9BACT|nr:hypothetical protein [Desulfomonile tiedjei]